LKSTLLFKEKGGERRDRILEGDLEKEEKRKEAGKLLLTRDPSYFLRLEGEKREGETGAIRSRKEG